MWTPHNYFGPGESDYSTEPVDADDGIAREHDLLYEQAKTPFDIHVADAKAVLDFGTDFYNTGNWHSLLGATALGFKLFGETISNRVFYPNLQGAFDVTAGLSPPATSYTLTGRNSQQNADARKAHVQKSQGPQRRKKHRDHRTSYKKPISRIP